MNSDKRRKFAAEKQPAGSVLIVTMWIVLVLASLVIVFARTIRVEAIAAANHISSVKAEAVADGAINYVFAELSSEEESAVSYGSNPYEAVAVGDGYFWIIRPNLSDDKNHDFGVSDQAGKINLNSASLDMLLRLPGMTSELAGAIIDWRDQDQEITAGGAESEYYLLLDEPYYCKNAPLETVEEVLMIKGGDWEGLCGEDLNRNGVLDWNENDAEKSKPSDNSNGKLDYGFLNYVTVHSYETNMNKSGNERVNVNNRRSQNELAQIIQEAAGDDYTQIMTNIRAVRNYDNIIHFYYVSRMDYDKFNKIIDRLTTNNDQETIGLVNINTAPAEVLLCLPELEQSDVDALVSRRAKGDVDLSSILWVTKVLSEEKAKAIGGYITTNSFQYSADIAAVSADGRAFKRYLVLFDTAGDSLEVIYKQPLHQLGWPLDAEILENLKNGNSI